MFPSIERIKISSAGRQQLITLKRRTGLEHNNILCRHALCASLANPSRPPDENINLAGGLEIDWRVFAGEAEQTYWNLLLLRCLQDEGRLTLEGVRRTLNQHLHRGLSYLASKQDGLPIESKAR